MPLVPHGLDGDVVADLRVALRVAGHADAARTGCPSRPAGPAATARCRTARPAGRRPRPARTRRRRRSAAAGATISARWASSRTSRADRCGTTWYPWPASRSVRSSVASRPLAGDAVTVTVTSAGHPLQHRVLGAGRREHLVPAGGAAAAPRGAARAAAGRRGSSAPRRITRLRVLADEQFQFAFQAAGADVEHGQRQAEQSRPPRRLGVQRGVAALREPDHPPVVAEVVRPQLRVPVQPELGQDRAAEAAHQEVGEQVGAGLALQHRPHPVRAGEHVVAVQPGQPAQAQPRAQLVQRAVAAAVGVAEHHPQAAAGSSRASCSAAGAIRSGAVVQQRGQGMQLHRPAAAGGDLADVAAQRAAGDHRHPRRRGRLTRPGTAAARRSGR